MSETVCVQGGRDRPQSFLHSSGSWRSTGPGGMVGCRLLSSANDALQSALVLGNGSNVPDGDGGGEDELSDGSVEVHHHWLWQFELLHLTQEVHHLFSLFLVRELMFSSHLRSWVMMVPRKQKDSTVSTGESHRVMGAVGLGSSWNPLPSPLSLEHWAPSCSDYTRSPDGQSPTCRQTHPLRLIPPGWCRR